MAQKYRFLNMVMWYCVGVHMMGHGVYSNMFEQSGSFSAAFQYLLACGDIEPSYSFKQVVVQTQEKWLRPAGVERWQLTESLYSDAQQTQLWDALTQVGFVDEVKPTKKYYEYGVVLGARGHILCKRMRYIVSLLRSGVQVNQLVILTGQRALDPGIESPAAIQLLIRRYFGKEIVLPTQLATETDLVRLLVTVVDLSTLSRTTVFIVDAPPRIDDTGRVCRPRTKETVEQWCACQPRPGSCVVVSNQPHIWYQDAVMRSYMPAGFEIETVGPACAFDTLLAECLDAVARFLYQTYHFLKI